MSTMIAQVPTTKRWGIRNTGLDIPRLKTPLKVTVRPVAWINGGSGHSSQLFECPCTVACLNALAEKWMAIQSRDKARTMKDRCCSAESDKERYRQREQQCFQHGST